MKASVEQMSVADLKSVLPGLSKIISRRSTLPILGCVKVIHTPDHVIRLQADNLDEAVTVRLQEPSHGVPGEMIVPFEELATIAKRCAAGETIQLRDTGKVTSLVYGAAGTLIEKPLTRFDLSEFPPGREVTAEPFALDNAFKTAIKEAFECASSPDSGRYILNGACLDIDSSQQAHYVVGTDGRQLYAANSFLFDIPASLIVPARKFIQWQGFHDDGPWTLRFQPENKEKKTTARFRLDSERWTYVANPIEGRYPNWRQVVPDGKGPSRIVLGEPGVKTILEALPLLPGGDEINQAVSLEIKGEELILKARTGEVDKWNCITVPATVSGPGVTITMNRSYLARALKFGCLELILTDRLSPALCKGKGKTMVLSPLTPDKKATAGPGASPPPGPGPASQASAPAAQPTSAVAASEPSSAQTENVSAAAPSPATEPTVATANEGNQTVSNTTTVTPRSHPNGPATETEPSALDAMTKQLGLVREGAKKLLDDVSADERLLRQVAKEQKLNEKEMGKARAALRSLQSVEI